MKNKTLLFSIITLLIGFGSIALASDGVGSKTKTNSKSVQSGTAYTTNWVHSLRVNQNTGTVDPTDVTNAWQEALNFKKTGKSVSLNWESIGPDNVGGRTRAIIFDQKDATGKTLYAASVAGCIWKSTNFGSTWNKVNEATANLNVTCMVQTSDNAIYAGTGENNVSQGKGLFVSTDGNNFSLVAGTNPTIVGTVTEWGYINELATNSQGVLFVATNSGLKYKNQGATEWNTANYLDGTGASLPLNGFVWDVKVASDGMVVASVDGKCYISTGDFNSFVCHSTKEIVGSDTLNPDKLPATHIGRIEFSIPSTDANIIYASATDEFGYMDNVYRSNDKGATWYIIMPGKTTLTDVFGGNGLVANTIVVDPKNADLVYLGGTNLWIGYRVGTGKDFFHWGNAPFSSSTTFKYSNSYLHEWHHTYVFAPNGTNFFIGNDGGISIFDAQEGFKIMNKNYNVSQFISIDVNGFGNAIGGTLGNGVQYIGDGNTPQAAMEVFNGDLNNSGEGAYQVISKFNPNVFLLSKKGGPFQRTEDKGYSFSQQFLEADQTVPTGVYCPMIQFETFFDTYKTDTVTFKALKDIAAGDEITCKSKIYDFPFVIKAPQNLKKGDIINVIDPNQSKTFLALGTKIYYSKDVLDFTKTPEWWQVGTVSGNASCLAYSSDANHLYVGTETGKIYRISNLGYAYNADRADISSENCVVAISQISEFANRKITSIAVDPQDNQHIVITLGNYGNNDYVYNCTNSLDSLPTFISVQGNLPKAPVYSSLIEMNNSGMVILGTENGIFVSDNVASATWSKDSGPMGTIPVFALKQQTLDFPGLYVPNPDPNIPGVNYPAFTNYGVIYAASYGRALWASNSYVGIKDTPGSNQYDNLSLKLYPNPVSESAKIDITLPKQANVSIEVYDYSGKLVLNQNYGRLSNGNQTVSLTCTSLPEGSYFVRVLANNQMATTKFIVVK